MWTIVGLISKNPEISLSSRNNPEMSQHSSDVPIVVKFSIYISMRSSLNWVVSFKKYISPLSTMLFPMSETLKNRKCLNFLMFLQGVTDFLHLFKMFTTNQSIPCNKELTVARLNWVGLGLPGSILSPMAKYLTI